MEFQRSWNEKSFQKVISEDRHWSWGCDSLWIPFQERKHTLRFTHSCRNTVKGPEGSSVFLLLLKPCTQKRQDGWIFIGRISLFTSEQGLAGRGWAWARNTWTVTDPHSPLQLLGRTMHHRSLFPPTLQPQSPLLPSLSMYLVCVYSLK